MSNIYYLMGKSSSGKERLMRALTRERRQKEPKYAEMLRKISERIQQKTGELG